MIQLLPSSAVALLLLLTLNPALAENSPAQSTASEVEAQGLLQAAVDANHFAGVTAAFSRVDGIRWTGSAGFCDVEAESPCSSNMLMRIASMTKPMTAVAILQLHEKEHLDLDAPIATYLPNFPREAAARITTRQLIHHTAGIAGYESSKESETTEEYASLADAASVFENRKLLFEPGSSYSYTTYGYVVLGMIIESISGQTYEQYLQENIWDKASMKNTGIERFGRTYANKASLYTRTKKGRIKAVEANNLSNRIPGGGVYSTVEDMLRFGHAVLDGTLLSEESVAAMQTYPDVERGKNNPYGMGWFIYAENTNRGPLIGHTGEQSGASGQLMLLPQEGTVAVVLTNTSLSLQQATELSVELIRKAGAPE